MSFLESSKVHVFPYSSTRVNDLQARTLNEQNITNMIKKLTDYSNYIISYDDQTHIVEFVIQGYYFKADLSGLKDTNPLYANITLVEDDYGYRYLSGGDKEAEIITTDSDTYTLSSTGAYILELKRDYVQIQCTGLVGDGQIYIQGLEQTDLEKFVNCSIDESNSEGLKQTIQTDLKEDTSCKFSVSGKGKLITIVVYNYGDFEGVEFSDTQPADSKTSLQIKDLDGNIVSSNRYKFNSDSIDLNIDTIKCGGAHSLQ